MNAGHRNSPDVRWAIQNVPYEQVSYGGSFLGSRRSPDGREVVVYTTSQPSDNDHQEEYADQQGQQLEAYVASSADFGQEASDNYQQMALQSYAENESYTAGEQDDPEVLYEQASTSSAVRTVYVTQQASRTGSPTPGLPENPPGLSKLLPSDTGPDQEGGSAGVALDGSHLVFHSTEHGLHGLLLDRATLVRHSEVLDLHRHQIISSHISSTDQSQFLSATGEAVSLSLLSPIHRDLLTSLPSSSSFHPKHMLVQKYAAEVPTTQEHHLMVVGDGTRIPDPYVTSSVVGMEAMYVAGSPPPPTSGHQTLDIYLDRGALVSSSTSHRELLEASRFEQSVLHAHGYVSSTVDLPTEETGERTSPHNQVIDSSDDSYQVDTSDGILHSTTTGYVHTLSALSPTGNSSNSDDLADKADQLTDHLSVDKDSLDCASQPDSTASGDVSSHLRPRRDGKRFWCDDCDQGYEKECTRHRIQLIFDKPVLSRAWASLPASYLYVNKIGSRPDYETQYGVFAKKTIPKRTQFGPIEGVLVKGDERGKDKFLFVVDEDSGMLVFLDTSDESLSNWMRFVRPAENHREQNLILVQQGQYLYFNTTRAINPRTELRVWYSTAYAQKWSLPLLELDEEERKALEEQEKAWPCFECNQRFPSSEELQKHLNQHDDEDVDDESRKTTSIANRKTSKILKHSPKPKVDAPSGKESSPRKSRGRPVKIIKTGLFPQETEEKSEDFPCGVCGKHFPRQYSLQRHLILHSGEKKFKCPICDMKFSHVYNRNRHMRRHRQRGESSSELRLVKRASLFRRHLVCVHCHLYFDSSAVLSLHLKGHGATLQSREPCHEGEEQGEAKVKQFVCPQCQLILPSRHDLYSHTTSHGHVLSKSQLSSSKSHSSLHSRRNPLRPFKCDMCYKSFTTDERLIRHYLVHGSDDSKPLQCALCYKRFLNNSALSCHIKIHSDEKKLFECPICKSEFEQINTLKEHVHSHYDSGVYTCPHCQKMFEEYNQIRKHIRAFHSERRYPCEKCDKVFPRPDKLKLHMLRHSDHREFLCANCGKQFKRKDKLKEHMKRMHAPDREARLHAAKAAKPPSTKKFIPKVSPQDYHRFIYKCHQCLLGFKRRGMLVNHLAKRHPEVRPDSVPELNLPILKTTRDYYCQYCEKIYKSSSKRKAHILRNHPGAELPMSNRRKGGVPDIPGMPNPTFSQTVGSITTHPHHCGWCHKQYASKAKLLQHQRKKHIDLVTLDKTPMGDNSLVVEGSSSSSIDGPKRGKLFTTDGLTPVLVSVSSTPDSLPSADLLTQAMSELTQSLTEFRPGDLVHRITIHPGPEDRAAMTSPASSTDDEGAVETTTIDPSQFSQLLAQYQQQQQQVVDDDDDEDDDGNLSTEALVATAALGTRPWPLTITSYQGR